MLFLLYLFAVWLLITWAVARFVLSGSDHSQFDSDLNKNYIQVFSDEPEDKVANGKFMQTISNARIKARATRSVPKALAMVRDFADNLSDDIDSDCDFTQVEFEGVKAEWAVDPASIPTVVYYFIMAVHFYWEAQRVTAGLRINCHI